MTTWNNVMVYADSRPESAAALSEGLRLTNRSDGRVVAFDVLDLAPIDLPKGLAAMEQDELLQLIRQQRQDQLTEEIERVRGTRRLECKVVRGRPAFELIRHAVRGRHDLIVKAARGRDVRHSTSFGTVALHLVRKSPVPVLIVNPDERLLARPSVLCALELDDAPWRAEQNRNLLGAARSVAEVFDAPLHVVHVIDRGRLMVYLSVLGSVAFERLVEARYAQRRAELASHVARTLADYPSVQTHLVEGAPGDVIVEMVKRLAFSHLVLGSVEQVTPGLLIGSLAEEVLLRVECSVLTMKPSGFETPINMKDARPDEALRPT